MGRPRKAPHLKLITGSREPELPEIPVTAEFDECQDFPKAPDTLNPDGCHMWETLGPQLQANRLLTVVDLFALQQLCYCWQRHVIKQKAGMDITASEDNALKALYAEFGLTPRARKATAGKQIREPEKPRNPFDQIGKKPAA